MRPRIALGRLLIRLGKFIQSLPVAVMKADDLVEFGRRSYARPGTVEDWGRADLLDEGLHPGEIALLEHVPLRSGRLLVLGLGGGRDAIALARMGFDVTGVDFVPAMVQKAIENAAGRGVQIEGTVQEIAALQLPAGSYDLVWLSAAMYSCIPGRRRRVEMLRRIAQALKPGGYFCCQFHWDPRGVLSSKGVLARKVVALLTLGNFSYEKGDMLWADVEFVHAFSSQDELKSELEAGGFEVAHLDIPEETAWAGAVCQRRQPTSQMGRS